jgi:hypothetical protein
MMPRLAAFCNDFSLGGSQKMYVTRAYKAYMQLRGQSFSGGKAEVLACYSAAPLDAWLRDALARLPTLAF